MNYHHIRIHVHYHTNLQSLQGEGKVTTEKVMQSHSAGLVSQISLTGTILIQA